MGAPSQPARGLRGGLLGGGGGGGSIQGWDDARANGSHAPGDEHSAYSALLPRRTASGTSACPSGSITAHSAASSFAPESVVCAGCFGSGTAAGTTGAAAPARGAALPPACAAGAACTRGTSGCASPVGSRHSSSSAGCHTEELVSGASALVSCATLGGTAGSGAAGAAGDAGGPVIVGGPNSLLASKSSEYIMYGWKVHDCPRGDTDHDWATCCYAHPGEKARRRSPKEQPYQAACCPDVRRRGRCPRGDACPWAHSVFEIHLHPAKFRTKMCRDGVACTRQICFFAHDEGQLRTPSPEEIGPLEARRQALQAAQEAARAQAVAAAAAAKAAAARLAVPASLCDARARAWQRLASMQAQQERAELLSALYAADTATLAGALPLLAGASAGLHNSDSVLLAGGGMPASVAGLPGAALLCGDSGQWLQPPAACGTQWPQSAVGGSGQWLQAAAAQAAAAVPVPGDGLPNVQALLRAQAAACAAAAAAPVGPPGLPLGGASLLGGAGAPYGAPLATDMPTHGLGSLAAMGAAGSAVTAGQEWQLAAAAGGLPCTAGFDAAALLGAAATGPPHLW